VYRKVREGGGGGRGSFPLVALSVSFGTFVVGRDTKGSFQVRTAPRPGGRTDRKHLSVFCRVPAAGDGMFTFFFCSVHPIFLPSLTYIFFLVHNSNVRSKRAVFSRFLSTNDTIFHSISVLFSFNLLSVSYFLSVSLSHPPKVFYFPSFFHFPVILNITFF
jgi:hypothetical protein